MAGSHNYTMNINIKSQASGLEKTSSELTKLRRDVQTIDGKNINLKISIGGNAGKDIQNFLKNISSMEKSLSTLSTRGIQALEQSFSGVSKSATDAASSIGSITKAADSINSKGPTDLASGMGDIAKTSTDAASGIGQVATAADSINTGNAEELASAYGGVATAATEAASAMEKASGSSGGSGVQGYPNWSNSYGGRYGGMRYTGREIGMSDITSFIGNGKNAYELTIENAMNKTRNMAVAKAWTPEDGVSGMDAYWALDAATDRSLMTLNTLAAGINATAATTGASAKDIRNHAMDFADFGTMVLGLGYDEAVAQTAVMKLGRGLHGTFAALDQYGITMESLTGTGKWSGDENDLDGYMAAVSEFSGKMSKQLMQTPTGQVATLGKSASLGGYTLGIMEAQAMGGIIGAYKEADDSLRQWTKSMGWGADVVDNFGNKVLTRTIESEENIIGYDTDPQTGEKKPIYAEESLYLDANEHVVDDAGNQVYESLEDAQKEGFKQKKSGIGLSTGLIGLDQAISTYKVLKDTVLSSFAEIKDLQRLMKYGFKGIFGDSDFEYMDGHIVKMRKGMEENAKGPCPMSECPQKGVGGGAGSNKKKPSRWQRLKNKFKRQPRVTTHTFPTGREMPSTIGMRQYYSSLNRNIPKTEPSTSPISPTQRNKIGLSNREKLRRSGVMPTPKKRSSNVSSISGKNLNAPAKKLIPNYSSHVDGKFYPNSMTNVEHSKKNLKRRAINKNVALRREQLARPKPKGISSFNNKLKQEMKAGNAHAFLQSRRSSASVPQTGVKIPKWQQRAEKNRAAHAAKEQAWAERRAKGQHARIRGFTNGRDASWLNSRREQRAKSRQQRAEKRARQKYANKYGGFQSRTLGAIYDTKSLKKKAGKYIKTQRDKIGEAWGTTKRKSASKGNTFKGKARYGMTALRGMGSRFGKRMIGSGAFESLQRQKGSLMSQGGFVKKSITGSGAYKKLSGVAGAAKGQIVGNAAAIGGMTGMTPIVQKAKNTRVGQAVGKVKETGVAQTAKGGLGKLAGGAKAVGGAAWSGASKGVGAVASGIGKATGAIGGLASGFMGLLGPIGAVIMGVTLITGLLDAMGVDWMGPLQTAFGGVWDAMQPLVQGFGQWLADTAVAIGPILTSLAEGLAPILGTLGSLLAGGLGALGEALLPVIEGLGAIFSGGDGGGILDALQGGLEGLPGLFEKLGPVVQSFWDYMGKGAEGVGSFLGTIFDGVGMYITHIVDEIANTISGFITTIAGGISTGISMVYNAIISGVTGLATSIANGITAIATAISSSIMGIATAISSGIMGIALAQATGILMVGNAISSVIGGITGAIAGGIIMISTAIASGIMGIGGSIIAIITGVTTAVSAGLSAMGAAVSSVVSMIGMSIAMVITAIATAVAMGITQVATSIVSSITQITMSIINSFSSFASTVATTTASALFTLMSFQGQAVSIMGSTATDASNAFKSNFEIQSGIDAEMSGAYSTLCYWGDLMVAKAEEIGSRMKSALLSGGLGVDSPGYIWRGIDAEFAGALGAMMRQGSHMITSAYNTGKHIVTSWNNTQQHANYNPLDNVQRDMPTTVTLPSTDVTFANANLDGTNVSSVPITPVSSPVDLPTFTEPKMFKELKNYYSSGSEPAPVTFNHYGDIDTEERANKLMKFITHKMSFENKRANRTV